STPAARGVEVTAVIEDQTPFKQKFDPGHPDAGPDGYVKLPNVNVVSEMVNVQEAARAYEANVAVIVNIKAMITKTFEIGKR
ncbi:MAG: flagellar basal body rod protein FlgC, partial [bacterium]|nr:flagellar basal body rod protein FlgC [bacterium]